MILIKRYRILFKTIIKCTVTRNIRDLQFCMPNSGNGNYVMSFCETKMCNPTYNLNNIKKLNYSSNIEDIQSIQFKEKLLYDNINNHNVNLKMIISIVKDLENSAYSVSETLSLKLLNCCGDVLYNEPLKIRQELANRVWNFLKEKNCNLTIDHYHALLQTYIDNDYRIDPNEFIRNMTVKAEYDTYCLLLQVLPNSNTCKVAETFIADVHKADSCYDEKIYNALVYAYSINGNTEKAKHVIKLMEEQKIQPSTATYMHLMYAFAKNNDNNALIESLTRYKPSMSHVMKLIKFLSLSGNGIHIPDILCYLHPLTKEEPSITSLIIQLVHAGHSLDAYEVVTHIPLSNEAQHLRKTFALCLLEEMMRANVKQEVVLKVINDFAIRHDISDIWEQVALLTLKKPNEVLSLAVFNEIKTKGISISCNCFWPLLLSTQKSGQESDIYSIIKHMRALDVKIDCRTFTDYIFPCIDTSNPIIMVKKMLWNGVSVACIIEPLVQFLLNSNRLKESLITCDYFKKKVDCQNMLDSLLFDYITSKDIDSCIHFLFKSSYNGHGFAATFLKKLLEHPKCKIIDINDIIKFLTAMKYYDAMIAPVDVEDLKNKILYMHLDEEQYILTLISDLTANYMYNTNFGQYVHPEYMNPEQLHSHLQELKAKGKNQRGVLRKLLITLCNRNDAEGVNKIIRELDSKNLEWTAGMKLTLFDYYVKKKMIREASSTLCEVQSKYPQFKIDNFKVIRFAILLIEHDKIDEAFNVIRKCTINQKPHITKSINELLSLLVTKDTSNYTEQMINLLMEYGYCTNHGHLLRYLVLVEILRGNIDSAIDVFRNCAKQYKKTPARQELLIAVMKLPSNIFSQKQKFVKNIYDLIVQYHGKDKADVNLAVAFALCNQTKKLQNLFEKNRISEDLLFRQLLRLRDNDIITTTLSILDSIKDLTGMNLVPMCNLTQDIYNKRNDFKHALELEKKMKEKGIKTSEVFEKTFSNLSAS